MNSMMSTLIVMIVEGLLFILQESTPVRAFLACKDQQVLMYKQRKRTQQLEDITLLMDDQ